MGATYTRQSTYSDGDVITAAHTNDEFNQLLAAFQASTGHTHDGTDNEGGPITKLLGNTLTFGAGTAGTDITITFDGETSDGVLKWMEDEDHFKFMDDVVIDGTKRLYFNDEGGEYLHGDGTDLNIVAGADINIPANVGLTFGDDGEKIEGDGTDLTITGNNINLTATADVNIPSGVGITFATAEKIESDGTDLSITVGSGGDINIPANIGLTFGNDGEKIEGDGTDLTITGNNINLTGTADIIIPSGVGLILDGSGDEKIESDGTDISFSVGSNGDINIPANIGLTFGDDGEKIEGDGTDLTITGNNINLTATADVVIPADVGITFGSGEKIEGDNTDLTITSGAKINLTATSDIHVPNNVGIVFGGDSEKIEGDGTDMTISANNLTVDAAADITLDAGDADVVLKDDGTQYAAFTNSSGNLIIKSGSTTALTFSGADATIAGDLTISGDDLTMGTNTSGHIMVADGANFNPVAVSGDVTISSAGAVTIANGAVETAMLNANVITGQTAETSLDTSNDTILIHDDSASALKKTTLASISSALGGITDVVADTSPQLGGNLDMNGNDIVTTSNANLELAPNGTGKVVVKGNDNQGAIQFNCEANSHGQTIIAAPHSESASNVLTLPSTGGNARLVSASSTATLTNKTLTTPTINGATIGSANLATASNGDINFAPNGTGKIVVRGNTNQGKIVLNCESNSHGQTIIAAPHSESANNVLTLPSTGGDARLVSTASTATLTNKTLTSPKINEDVAVTATATELNIMDGVTATTAELNIMDGVTSTASELNLVDGSSAGTIVNSKAVIYGSSGEVNATTLQIAGTSITATAAELNHVDGVTSAIQTQLDAKASKGFATAMAIAL